MSLIEIRQLSAHVRLGLWRIDEPFEGSARERERDAVHRLLHAMTGDNSLCIVHEYSGKPILTGWHVSVSHTRGFASLILSDCSEVAVDIEYQSDRVGRIAKKFIRDDEPVVTVEEMLLLWSAKETLYKLHSSAHLQYFDMRLLGMSESIIQLEDMKNNEIVEIHFERSDDFVLTYSF